MNIWSFSVTFFSQYLRLYGNECSSNSIKRDNNDDLFYLSLNKIYFCKPICNEETPFEIILTQECVEKCDYKGIQNKSCILNYKNNNIYDNITIKIYDDLLKNVEDEFTSENYNTTNLEKSNDEIPLFTLYNPSKR